MKFQPDTSPMKVLKLPDVFLAPVEPPAKTFERPDIFPLPAKLPKNELQHPVVSFTPAFTPKKALKLPSKVLAFGVTAAPAPIPARVLLFAKEPFPPVTVNTREPPMLYCFVAFTTFPDKVPPALPSPLMLKLLLGC